MAAFTGTIDEARFLLRLVKAYQAAQDVLMHTGFILDQFNLRKKGTDHLDLDRMIALSQRLKIPQEGEEE